MASMADQVPVSSIVVSYETRSLTLDAASSLERNLPAGSEIWVVDNASSDGSAEAVEADFPEAGFSHQGRWVPLVDGLTAKVSVRVRSQRLIVALIPALRELLDDG